MFEFFRHNCDPNKSHTHKYILYGDINLNTIADKTSPYYEGWVGGW
jgi:hypothetical protein